MKKALLLIFFLLINIVFIGCQVDQTSPQTVLYFDSNGGSYISSISLNEETSMSMPQAPTKNGYVFDGWYYDNGTFDQPFTIEDLSSLNAETDIEVYAKWDEVVTTQPTNNSLYDQAFKDELALVLEEGQSVIGLYGVTVSVNGQMIGEDFYNTLNRNLRYNIYSVTKSINAILVGIAIDMGYIDSVEDSIGRYIDLSGYDNQLELSSIKIKHLLTMTDGIYWDGNDLANELIGLRASLNPLDYILERDIVHSPGQVFNYSGGATHLMSHIISIATQMKPNDFALQYLFEPLGISEPYWAEDQSGVNIGGSDLHLSNYELDIIGQMMLNQGVYNDQRIVSESWVNVSTSPSNHSFYGYYWWLNQTYGLDIIQANGFGGQHIYIIPEYQLVITSLASAYVVGEAANIQYNLIESFILDDILKLFYDQN